LYNPKLHSRIMKILLSQFTNREIALFIWVLIFILFTLSRKNLRECYLKIIKAFFVRQILTEFFLQILYIFLILLVLLKYKIWGYAILKETIFWWAGVAVGALFKTNEIKNASYFKNIILKNIRWAFFLEFIVNLYTFKLVTELFLVPIIIFTGLVTSFTKNRKEDKIVYNFFSKFLNIISLLLVIFIAYKTFKNYKELFNIHSLQSILLPLILTTLLLPFIYFQSLYNHYQTLFIKLKFITRDKYIDIRLLKKQLLLLGNLNLCRVISMSSKIWRFNNSNLFASPKILKRYFNLNKVRTKTSSTYSRF